MERLWSPSSRALSQCRFRSAAWRGRCVCTDQPACDLLHPPGQRYARLRRNTGEGKAGFLISRSLQTCYGTQRKQYKEREMPNKRFRQQTLPKDKHLKQVITPKACFLGQESLWLCICNLLFTSFQEGTNPAAHEIHSALPHVQIKTITVLPTSHLKTHSCSREDVFIYST